MQSNSVKSKENAIIAFVSFQRKKNQKSHKEWVTYVE